MLSCIWCRSQCPRGLSRRSAAARLLESWVRIPPGAWTFVCCECCVLSGRGLCDELITCPEESFRLWCVVCNLETSWKRSHTQSVVVEHNRRCINGCISYTPLIVTAKHDCWMSSDRLQCSGELKKCIWFMCAIMACVRVLVASYMIRLSSTYRVYSSTFFVSRTCFMCISSNCCSNFNLWRRNYFF